MQKDAEISRKEHMILKIQNIAQQTQGGAFGTNLQAQSLKNLDEAASKIYISAREN